MFLLRVCWSCFYLLTWLPRGCPYVLIGEKMCLSHLSQLDFCSLPLDVCVLKVAIIVQGVQVFVLTLSFSLGFYFSSLITPARVWHCACQIARDECDLILKLGF